MNRKLVRRLLLPLLLVLPLGGCIIPGGACVPGLDGKPLACAQ